MALISLRDFLQRFRRGVSPPGAALPRLAPPADSSAALRAELEPLFALIDEIQERAEAVRTRADENAAERIEAARREADAIVRAALSQAPAIREQVAAEQRRRVEEEIETAFASARQEADQVRALAESRAPELAAQVVDLVMSIARGPS